METELAAALLEIGDASLYEREVRLFRLKVIDGERIGERFALFAEQERAHLAALKQIFPGLEKSLGKPVGEAPVNSLRSILKNHAERELAAIHAYEKLLLRPLAPLHALLVKGILCDERKHLETVLHYLKGINAHHRESD